MSDTVTSMSVLLAVHAAEECDDDSDEDPIKIVAQAVISSMSLALVACLKLEQKSLLSELC